MKILLCVQRYGEEIVGGGESFTRAIAEGLAARGHDVHVATSSALNYQTWAPHYPAGDSMLNGVAVHRFDSHTRDKETFLYMIDRAHGATILGQPLPEHLEEQWLRVVGPTMPTLEPWLGANLGGFDVALGVTYQYAHILHFIRAIRSIGTVPFAFIPLSHHEVTLALDLFDDIFGAADALLFLTPEEQLMIEERIGTEKLTPHRFALGAPVDPPPMTNALPPRPTWRKPKTWFQYPSRPYVVAVGRLDPSKGFDRLAKAWNRVHWRFRGFPQLVVVGSGGKLRTRPLRIKLTGFVDDSTLDALMRNAIALVHPSSFESFSIVCCEAWLRGTPIVVTKDCDVLVGQCARSQGGLAYDDDAELVAIIERLAADKPLRDALAANGSRYVQENYTPGHVIDLYEQTLQTVIERGPLRSLVATRAATS